MLNSAKEKKLYATLLVFLFLSLFLSTLGFHFSNKSNAEDTVLLYIDPNGGYFNGSTSVYVQPQWTGWNYTFADAYTKPSRPGYEFIEWQVASGDGQLSSQGRLMFNNPFFDNPHMENEQDNLRVYNNAGTGNVSITNVAPAVDLNWPSQKNMLKISNTGAASPGLGGFATAFNPVAGGIYYQYIYAKIPVGYTLNVGMNPMGDGGYYEFRTSQEGTGNWELYRVDHHIGTTGKISTCGYIYLNGSTGSPEKPVDWYIAYAGTYNATNIFPLINTVKGGTTNTTIRALWKEDSWATHSAKPPQNANGVYEVSTAAELGYFAAKAREGDVKDSIILKNDIDLKGHDWVPIGMSDGKEFAGKFNGNGHTIYNMQISDTTADNVGLFGFVDYNSSIWEQAVIENVHLVKASVRGKNHVGGIAGFAWRTIIRNCSFSGNIIAIGNQVGGIVGIGYHNTEIANSYVSADIRGQEDVGGIVGAHQDEATTFKNNYFMGKVTGSKKVGGILGCDFGVSVTILNSGVNGEIISLQDSSEMSGIVGKSTVNININDCYSIVSLTKATGYINGIYGSVANQSIDNSYTVCQSGQSTLKLMFGNQFKNWTYIKPLNDGYPVQKGLYHVGGAEVQDVYAYLRQLNFSEA